MLTLLNRIILTSGSALYLLQMSQVLPCQVQVLDGSVVTVDVNVRQSAVCLVSVQLASVHTVPHDHCMFVYNILLRCRYNFCRRKLSVMFYSTKCIAMLV